MASKVPVDTGVDPYDFYQLEEHLPPEELEILHNVHRVAHDELGPLIFENWRRATFPPELVEVYKKMQIAGIAQSGYEGGGGRSNLLDGMIAMELGRLDCSVATFNGVHSGLAMGSIYLTGSEEQKQQWLPAMSRTEKIGSFGLTEPDVGSGAAGGLTTSAKRDGDTWILNGQKKWIGNATIGDLTIIWARDEDDKQVKGFIVPNDTPGFVAETIHDKISLRIVQNALITLTNVRVPEENRLQNANSFADTAKVLRATRAGVAWMAIGCMRGAYDNALAYAKEREQFGRPIGGFQLIQDLLVRMLGNITSSWALCTQLSKLQDAGKAEDHHSALAKAFCTVKMRESVGFARELMGGNGILQEMNVGRFVADAEAIYSYEGTREMNTLIVGRSITGLGAFV